MFAGLGVGLLAAFAPAPCRIPVRVVTAGATASTASPGELVGRRPSSPRVPREDAAPPSVGVLKEPQQLDRAADLDAASLGEVPLVPRDYDLRLARNRDLEERPVVGRGASGAHR